MNVRHLATKGFDTGVDSSRSIVYDGVPITVRGTSEHKEDIISFSKPQEQKIGVLKTIQDCSDRIKEGPIGSIVFDGDSVLPLSRIFDFKTIAGDQFCEDGIPVGTSFSSLYYSDFLQERLSELAVDMFPNRNPNTGKPDVDADKFYSSYIPLVVISGCLPVQTVGEEAFFNPEGIVTIAEFLDSLNAIKRGSNSNVSRKKSLDNISDVDDYFNEGYLDCLAGLSSPFFNLYTRAELLQPITRVELAYITCICWTQFVEKYNSEYGTAYYLGINFDWNAPGDVLKRYVDGFSYKVSKISLDKRYHIVSLNIKDYKSDRSMTEYKEDLRGGKSPIPLPMLMSLVEIGVVDLYHFEDNRLDPLKEVSRGELCYFLSHLAQLFPTKYI